MSKTERLAQNNIKAKAAQQSRAKQNTARKSEGSKKPGTDGGGKSKGAAAKILRYPLAIIDDSTDYLSIKIQDYKLKPSTALLDTTTDLETLEQNAEGKDVIKRSIVKGKELSAGKIFEGLVQQSNVQRGSQVNTTYNITLPIPNNITDSNSVSWGEDSLNPLQAAGMNAIQNVGAGANPLEQLGVAGNELLDMAGQAGPNEKKSIIAAIAAFGVGANPEALISRATGQILNPNLELLFSGVNLRAFSFMFDFAPRSYDEGQMVKQIIRAFKKTMVPASATGIFVKPPSVYQLMYMQGASQHPFLNSFKPCALVNMDINYTGSGTYATYRDGTPVHMQMQLTFKELNPVYGENYSDQQTNVGY